MRTEHVRRRLTVVAGLVTLGVLLVASLVLVAVFQRSEARHADRLDQGRLGELSALARGGDLPARITDVGDDGFAQVVVDGRVVAASPSLGDAGPVTRWVPGAVMSVRDLDDVPDDDETEDYRVWGVTVAGQDGPVTVYVGTAREVVRESARSLALTLAVGAPLLLAVALGLIWVLVGRTLRPVEAAQARQRGFVADAAHELQSPLASYRAQLEVSLRDPAGTDWAETARELLAESDRMERLVRDLLFLARQDEQGSVPRTLSTWTTWCWRRWPGSAAVRRRSCWMPRPSARPRCRGAATTWPGWWATCWPTPRATRPPRSPSRWASSRGRCCWPWRTTVRAFRRTSARRCSNASRGATRRGGTTADPAWGWRSRGPSCSGTAGRCAWPTRRAEPGSRSGSRPPEQHASAV